MKFALVILETPKSISHEAEQAWTNTISFSRDRTQKSGKVQILNDGCYLCDLSNGLFDLSYICAQASNFGVQSRTLFFDQDLPFVITKGKDA